jgi:hypothetical protein
VPHYFLLHDSHFFQECILPAFGRSWQSSSFEPIGSLAPHFRPGIAAFTEKFRMGTDETVLEQIARGMQFDRDVWEMAFGEALFFGAREAPDAPVSFTSLHFLLASQTEAERLLARSEWPWIDRAVLGSRTFRFGRGSYRTQDAGWNSPMEAKLLAAEALGVDSGSWQADQLEKLDATLEEEDRRDELALAQQALQQLRSVYDRAVELESVVVCERIS